MDFEDNQEKNDFGKAPFYTGAFFILIVIAIFAFVSFQEEGNLDHWVIVSCLLGKRFDRSPSFPSTFFPIYPH